MTRPSSGRPKMQPDQHAGDAAEHHAVADPDQRLASDQPPGVAGIELLRGERAHRHRQRLRAGVAAEAGDDRKQHGEDGDPLDRVLEEADHRGGEEGGDEIDEQPRASEPHDRKDALGNLLVADAGEALDILVRLLLDDVDDVVDGDDADQPARPRRPRRPRAGCSARKGAPRLPGRRSPRPNAWPRSMISSILVGRFERSSLSSGTVPRKWKLGSTT